MGKIFYTAYNSVLDGNKNRKLALDALKKAAIKSFDLIRKNSDIDELKAVGDIVDICYYYAEKEFYILKEAKLQKTKEKVEIKSEMLNICEFMKTLGDNLDPQYFNMHIEKCNKFYNEKRAEKEKLFPDLFKKPLAVLLAMSLIVGCICGILMLFKPSDDSWIEKEIENNADDKKIMEMTENYFYQSKYNKSNKREQCQEFGILLSNFVK